MANEPILSVHQLTKAFGRNEVLQGINLTVRTGEVIGDHEVTFTGPADRIVFAHYAQDRSIFARGAITAALWLLGKRRAAATQVGALKGIISVEAFFQDKYKK